MADDIARLGFEIDSTQALSAARNLLTMEQAAGKAAIGAAKLVTRFRSADGRFISNARAAADNAREIEQLAAKYNTALSAELAYANAQQEVARAVQLGVLSSQQADAALEQLQQGYLATGAAAGVMGTQVGAANRHILNMGFQFQDIAMMMASGQSPLILAMQQGTQVAGIFNQMKLEGQSAFSALRGGLMGLVNPTSLVTIGVIAGAAALGQWVISAIGAGDEAETLSDRMDRLSELQSGLQQTGEILRMSVEELTERYGQYAESVRQAAQALSQLQIAEIERTLREQAALAADATREYYALAASGPALRDAILRIEQAFDVTRAQAFELEEIMQAIGTARTFDQQTAALRRMQGFIEANNISMSQLPVGIQNALSEMLQLEIKTSEAAVTAERFRSISNGGAWFTNAIDRAIVLRDVLLEAAGAASAAAKERDPNLLLGETDPLGLDAGGGGGTDQRQSQLDQFIEGLRTESEALQAWRTEQLDLLAQYNESELAAIGGHNEARLRIEQEYQDRMAEIRSAEREERMSGYRTMFGDLSSLMQTESMKLFRIGQAAAIANAVMEGWESAVSAWRWGMKFGGPPLAAAASAASLAKTGAMIANIASQNPQGSGGGGAGGGSSAGTTAPREPRRTILVSFDGPDWARDMFEDWTNQLYEASGDGRVIFNRR